jgi:hypothetical protein
VSAPRYTLRSFVELAERENRRGKDIGWLDPDVRRATRSLQKRRELFLTTISKYKRDDPAREPILQEYRDARQKLRQDRDDAVESALHQALSTFETKLDEGTFSFALGPGPVAGTKQTYCIDPDLGITFPAKQAAEAIKSAAFLDAANRNSIVRALKEALKKGYGHAIYKVDVMNFFESIPHSTLLARMARPATLDGVSVQLARQLLSEFEAITGDAMGLPRGVGLSSQLAELYMSDFDLKVKMYPGVLFYARYVDDVVVVVEHKQALEAVQDVVASELKNMALKINGEKTREIKTDEKGNYEASDEVEYLGYRFVRSDNKLITGLTDKRKGRRMNRLDLALEHWINTEPNETKPNHGHDGILVDRLRYLAGNTKLLNSKSNVAIGLFHSNSALDESASELEELDALLESFLDAHGSKMTDGVRKRIKNISFVEMFASRPFLRLRQKRIEQIVRIWKEAAA